MKINAKLLTIYIKQQPQQQKLIHKEYYKEELVETFFWGRY